MIMDPMHTVFVKTDALGRITDVISEEFLPHPEGYTAIDCGAGERFFHAQSRYFDKPLKTDSGAYRYALLGASPIERSAKELAADAAALSAPPAPLARIAALEEENAMLLSCLLEMSEVVYA